MARPKKTELRIYLAFLCSLAFLFIASFFPEQRLWGFNEWAYIPDIWRYIYLFIGVALVILLFFTRDKLADITLNHSSNRIYLISIFLYGSALGLLFYWFKAETHFGGDGYTVLSSLASDTPLVKYREIGEAFIHLWLKNAIGTGEAAALTSFQVLSIASGIIFVILAAMGIKHLSKNTLQRASMLVMMTSGGYMLLFFGYVEHYSIFVLSVLLFAVIGTLIAQGRISRLFILAALRFR